MSRAASAAASALASVAGALAPVLAAVRALLATLDGPGGAAALHRGLAGLVALHVVLCLIWAALVMPVPYVSDTFAYHTFARTIAEHGVYGWSAEEPTAYWAVGAAAVYAAAYSVLGVSGWTVFGVNVVAGGLAVTLTGLLGARWVGRPQGLLAAAAIAVWPVLIQFSTVPSSELLSIAFALVALWMWERSRDAGAGPVWLVLTGLAFAAAVYVRPVTLLVPFVLAGLDVLRGRAGLARTGLRTVVVVVMIGVALAPWAARNQALFGERVLVSTNFGANFWMGNNPQTRGGYMPLPPEVAGMSETERSDHLLALAMEHVRAEPEEFLTRTLWKVVLLHDRETIGAAWNRQALEARYGWAGYTLARLVATGWWYLMLALALGGVATLFATQRFFTALTSPPFVLWGYYTGVHAVIVAMDRYHMPAIPFIAMLAAVAAHRLLAGRSRGGA